MSPSPAAGCPGPPTTTTLAGGRWPAVQRCRRRRRSGGRQGQQSRPNGVVVDFAVHSDDRAHGIPLHRHQGGTAGEILPRNRFSPNSVSDHQFTCATALSIPENRPTMTRAITISSAAASRPPGKITRAALARRLRCHYSDGQHAQHRADSAPKITPTTGISDQQRYRQQPQNNGRQSLAGRSRRRDGWKASSAKDRRPMPAPARPARVASSTQPTRASRRPTTTPAPPARSGSGPGTGKAPPRPVPAQSGR